MIRLQLSKKDLGEYKATLKDERGQDVTVLEIGGKVYDDMILAMSRVCGKYLPSRFRVVMGSRVSISWGGGTCHGGGPGGPGVHRPAPGQGPRPMASATICEGVGSITCRMFRFKNNGLVWASRRPAPPDVPWVNWGDGSVHNCCQHLCDKR